MAEIRRFDPRVATFLTVNPTPLGRKLKWGGSGTTQLKGVLWPFATTVSNYREILRLSFAFYRAHLAVSTLRVIFEPDKSRHESSYVFKQLVRPLNRSGYPAALGQLKLTHFDPWGETLHISCELQSA